MSVENNEFPKYEMIADGNRGLYILKDAGLLLGDNTSLVVFGDVVLTSIQKSRKMTPKDKVLIQRISEEYEDLKPTKTE